MQLKLKLFFPLIGACSLIALPAYSAAPDPLTGVRVSLIGLQTVLASPPLPSLDIENRGEATFQLAYLKARVNDSYSVAAQGDDSPSTGRARGSFKGYGFGIGLTTSARHDFGFYGFGIYNSINGDLRISTDGFPTALNLADMKNTGAAFATGVSLRLIGTKKNALSMGIFAGPTLSYFTSTFKAASEDTSVATVDYSATPSTYGAMGGVQMGVTIAKVYLNPYAIYYRDLSDGCKDFNPGGATPNSECSGRLNALKLPLSFGVYGINVGFYNLFITAYSQLENHETLETIDLTKFQISYAFKF